MDAGTGQGDLLFSRCLQATTVRAACAGVVDDLHDRWDLPSVYLLIDGRLRCYGARGYFQVSDGFSPSTGVIGRVVTDGRAVVIQDVSLDGEFVAAIPGLRAEVCVPVRLGDTVVGAVNVESREVLSDRAIADVERAAALLGSRLDELGGLPDTTVADRMARIAVDLATQTDAGSIRSTALRGALDLSGTRAVGLAAPDPDGVWSVVQAEGELAAGLLGWDDSLLRLLSGWVSAGTSSSFPRGEVVSGDSDVVKTQFQAVSIHPLHVRGALTGLLITADTAATEHDPVLTSAMELLATQTATVLAMAATIEYLEEQAIRDPLTGLVNRRGFLDALDALVGQSATAEPHVSLVTLDLDGFKAVNDAKGHAAGDEVLRAVADRLQAAARHGDLVCRLGGDEFAVLVQDCVSPHQALAAGNRILAAVREGSAAAGHPSVSASAGVRLISGPSSRTVLADADAALYAAKRAGRGRTSLASPLTLDEAASP